MLLDKETVTKLLDKEQGTYDDNLLAIKLLPNDAIFEIVIEEVVTAEYFDSSKNEYFRFELGHEYFSYGKEISESHKRNLDLSLNQNLLEHQSKVNEESRKVSRWLKWTVASFVLLVTLFFVTYLYTFYAL